MSFRPRQYPVIQLCIALKGKRKKAGLGEVHIFGRQVQSQPKMARIFAEKFVKQQETDNVMRSPV